MGETYWRKQNRVSLVRRLEIAVECGVVGAFAAVETYDREAWQARLFFRSERRKAFDRLYDAGHYRLALEMGMPVAVASRIGSELRAFHRRVSRELTEQDVRAILVRLYSECSGTDA